MIRLLAAVALLAPLPAQAQNWYYASANDQLTAVSFVDKDSIVASGQFRRAHVLVVTYDNPETAAVDAVIEYDCTTAQFRMIENISYHADGTAFRPEKTPTDPWHEVKPDTFYRPARDFVCSGGTSLAVERNMGSALPIKQARDFMQRRRAERDTKP